MPSTSNWLSPGRSRPAASIAATINPPNSSSTNATSPALATPHAPHASPQSAAIQSHLTAKSLPSTPAHLSHLLTTLNTSQPLPALKASALYRTLHTDLKTCLLTTAYNTFPADILDATIPLRTLPSEIIVQILAIEDIGRSRWFQIEALEAAERGETTKGREVIRVVPGEANLGSPDDAAENEGSGRGPHKLLLEPSTMHE